MEDRLLKFLDTEQLSSSKFADVIGVQRSSVSHILTGRNKPSFDFLQKTLKAFPMLNADWLILGEGDMYEGERGPGGGSLFDQPAVVREMPASDQEVRSEDQPSYEASSTVPGEDIHEAAGDGEENVHSGEVQRQGPKVLNNAAGIPEDISPELPAGKMVIPGKKVQRVVLLYDDNSFDAYEPA
ncbi:MAG: helix-turn-helix transcriptional regulator [Bacteroidales bacterium]|nr:helix-turn-helix transcriptional regulator [Bacteroidales bacterium]